MFEQAVQTSDALQRAAGQGDPRLIPSLCGCLPCQTARMIAGPVLGVCQGCGAELTVLGSDEARAADPESLTRAA